MGYRKLNNRAIIQGPINLPCSQVYTGSTVSRVGNYVYYGTKNSSF